MCKVYGNWGGVITSGLGGLFRMGINLGGREATLATWENEETWENEANEATWETLENEAT